MAKAKVSWVCAGQVFGRLTVMEVLVREKGQRLMCIVQCSCGSPPRITKVEYLLAGTLSCGCYQVEHARAVRTVHGAYQSPEHNTWKQMRARCNNPRCPKYKDYGGRGIAICKRWLQSFNDFLLDMGHKPSRTHTIDRIDNNHGYDCGHCDDCLARGAAPNCRWASPREQGRNQRTNRVLTVEGRSMLLVEWSEAVNIPEATIYNRIRRGWSEQDAVMMPVKTKHRHKVAA